MDLRTRLAAIAVAALLLTGCAANATPQETPAPEPVHTMADGMVMEGAEHSAQPTPSGDAGPSAAASMVCGGQVETAIASLLKTEGDMAPTPTWNAPMFSCTYDVDGAPLVLSVNDATDVATGERHFAEVQAVLGAADIEGMLGLGLPSFSTGDGMVGFLRDGKTLLVDATALPDSLADGTMTRDDAAYAAASAVLGCWVEHD